MTKDDETTELLMTMPGIGFVGATMIASYVDDIERFHGDFKKFSAYLGIVPSVHNSADRVHMGHITKRGPQELRTAFVQVATGIIRQPQKTSEWKLMKDYHIIAFIDKLLEQNGCDAENRLRVQLAVDEIFTNIVNYAYGAEGGKVEIAFSCKDDIAEITFADSGVPYDPLQKDDPDLTLSPEEMQVGGLGVFIAKNNMDTISYRYENNRNILTMSKYIRHGASER